MLTINISLPPIWLEKTTSFPLYSPLEAPQATRLFTLGHTKPSGLIFCSLPSVAHAWMPPFSLGRFTVPTLLCSFTPQGSGVFRVLSLEGLHTAPPFCLCLPSPDQTQRRQHPICETSQLLAPPRTQCVPPRQQASGSVPIAICLSHLQVSCSWGSKTSSLHALSTHRRCSTNI